MFRSVNQSSFAGVCHLLRIAAAHADHDQMKAAQQLGQGHDIQHLIATRDGRQVNDHGIVIKQLGATFKLSGQRLGQGLKIRRFQDQGDLGHRGTLQFERSATLFGKDISHGRVRTMLHAR